MHVHARHLERSLEQASRQHWLVVPTGGCSSHLAIFCFISASSLGYPRSVFLNVCFAYTSRHEIAHAMRLMAEGVECGQLHARCVSLLLFIEMD